MAFDNDVSLRFRWRNFVEALAMQRTDLRELVATEYVTQLLPVLPPTIAGLPEEQAGRLTDIGEALRQVEDNQRGSVSASIEAMDDDEFHSMVKDLVDIAFRVWG